MLCEYAGVKDGNNRSVIALGRHSATGEVISQIFLEGPCGLGEYFDQRCRPDLDGECVGAHQVGELSRCPVDVDDSASRKGQGVLAECQPGRRAESAKNLDRFLITVCCSLQPQLPPAFACGQLVSATPQMPDRGQSNLINVGDEIRLGRYRVFRLFPAGNLGIRSDTSPQLLGPRVSNADECHLGVCIAR